MQPLLDISGLSVSYKQNGPAIHAVRDVSFTIMPAEIVALVGESGSGKSVLSMSLLQLLPPEADISGQAVFMNKEGKGNDLIRYNQIRTVRGNSISMIFQEPMTSLNPLMRCGKQITEAIRTHKKCSEAEALDLAVNAMKNAGLSDPGIFLDRFPHQLSGGQKQRIMIAMAICCNPALLIADEPTTALDVKTQKDILDSIKKLRDQTGMAILFITHDLALVSEWADKVLVMKSGSIVESGIPANVLSKPAHPYTQSLVAAGTALRTPPPATARETGHTMNQNPELDIRELSVTFDSGRSRVKAVDNVSFSVFPGETVGIVGESGCGKTTIGKTIIGLQKQSSGTIRMKGVDLPAGEFHNKMRKKIQIVFQDPYGSLNPRITAGSAIREVLKIHPPEIQDWNPDEQVEKLLGTVQLEKSMASRFPHQLSGGQRQRICIARALAARPSLLIFDEALSALDLSVQWQMADLIGKLKASTGISCLFITHDLGIVKSLCDRVLIMKSGKLIESGTPARIFSAPDSPYTRELLKAIPGKL